VSADGSRLNLAQQIIDRYWPGAATLMFGPRVAHIRCDLLSSVFREPTTKNANQFCLLVRRQMVNSLKNLVKRRIRGHRISSATGAFYRCWRFNCSAGV
jgi:hypothetical protein